MDEVQELEGWENMVNACTIDFDADIYITGSNAKLLSGELATYLGGSNIRNILIEVKYREQAAIAVDDAICELSVDASASIIVTKRYDDYGVHDTPSGKKNVFTHDRRK